MITYAHILWEKHSSFKNVLSPSLIGNSSINFQRNKVLFEKFICKYQPGSKVDPKYRCIVKYIDRNHLKVDLWGNLTAPISALKFRLQFYYKYNSYQRVGGDFNVDICEEFSKKERMSAIKWLLEKLSQLTNVNHKCPYEKYLYAKVDNVSMEEFDYPQIMPGGRYRIDTTLFEDNNRILFNTSVYFSISDHRLDVRQSVL